MSDYDIVTLVDALSDLIGTPAPGAFLPPEVSGRADTALGEPALAQRFAKRAPLPACRHLDRIFSSAPAPEVAATIAAFNATWPAMHWIQNENYRDQPAMQAYLADSGYCELVGTRALVPSTAASVGFFLMGPGIHYPAHNHPAAEAYIVLSGTAEWWREGEDWVLQPPASRIYHAPYQIHAMRTQGEPLLACFVWSGDLVTLPSFAAKAAANKAKPTHL